LSEVEGYDDVVAQEGGRPPRPPVTPAQRRARRQAITLLLVGGLLLVSFLFAAAYYGGWFSTPKAKGTAGACPTVTATSKVQPSQVQVNVYNASNRNGLAKKVAGEMKTQGYVTGKVANDPLHATVKTSAQVRYGPKGKEGAELVASEVSGAKLVLDKRKDATVDLVLGSTYSVLGTPPSAKPSSNPSCHPSTTPTGTPSKKSTPTGTKTTKKA
jgi:hypothetical protein